MKKNIFLLIIALFCCAAAVNGQGRAALRINEVMVVNDSNAVDDFGHRHAWIELFNSNHAPMEISSVFITNDPQNPRKYPVPLGDVNTRIPKRQHVVFWADGMPSRGTFHLNFLLEEGKDNWIGVYDANGITLIDSVTVPASLGRNQSYARSEDGAGVWQIRDDHGENYITPSSNNVIRDQNDKIALFKARDANGFAMTIMAMCIVFSALLCLCLAFLAISKIGASIARRNKMEAQGIAADDATAHAATGHDTGEEIAAIAMALRDHFDAHDQESTILTINKVRRSYSPWSSKIYGMRQLPK
ncbi:MAG: lamin tail domain-containing protein [Bacteroidales bacterium]|nr:lamin tail domain-containing protein [Bacteroidales bacterium]